MSRFDWDRLRRVRPLDGADARLDPDGAVVWERGGDRPWTPLGARLLRAGVVVRRAKDRSARAASTLEPPSEPAQAAERAERVRATEPSALPAPASAPAAAPESSSAARSHSEAPVALATCPQCGASVSARRLVRHVRKTCRGRRRQARDRGT